MIKTNFILRITNFYLIRALRKNKSISKEYRIEKVQTILVSLSILLLLIINIQKQEKTINKNNIFIIIFLILTLIISIVFVVNNAIKFFIFFETSIVPIFVIVAIWGQAPEKLQAAFYIMIYTILSRLPFLGRVLINYKNKHTTNIKIQEIIKTKIRVWWMATLIIFLVKIPRFMVHIWLPKAHVESPVTGSIVLAGAMLKIGRYGIVKFIPIIIENKIKWQTKLISVGIAGRVAVSVLCSRQNDLKVIIAYSSVVHIRTILATIITITKTRIKGAFYIIVAHGLCSALLFFNINLRYKKTISRNIQINKGITRLTPISIMFWFLACIANISAPPSVNFSREIIITRGILSIETLNLVPTIIANIIIGVYCVTIFRTVSHGRLYLNQKENTNNTEILIQMNMITPLILIYLITRKIL